MDSSKLYLKLMFKPRLSTNAVESQVGGSLISAVADKHLWVSFVKEHQSIIRGCLNGIFDSRTIKIVCKRFSGQSLEKMKSELTKECQGMLAIETEDEGKGLNIQLLNEHEFVIEVRPLSLGSVKLDKGVHTRAIDERITTRPIEDAVWFSKLRAIPFRAILLSPIVDSEIRDKLSFGSTMTAGNLMSSPFGCDTEGKRWINFKLSDSVIELKSIDFVDYFGHSFADCIFSAPFGSSASLIIGALDYNHRIIGCPWNGATSEATLVNALVRQLSSLFPAIQPEHISICIHPVEVELAKKDFSVKIICLECQATAIALMMAGQYLCCGDSDGLVNMELDFDMIDALRALYEPSSRQIPQFYSALASQTLDLILKTDICDIFLRSISNSSLKRLKSNEFKISKEEAMSCIQGFIEFISGCDEHSCSPVHERVVIEVNVTLPQLLTHAVTDLCRTYGRVLYIQDSHLQSCDISLPSAGPEESSSLASLSAAAATAADSYQSITIASADCKFGFINIMNIWLRCKGLRGGAVHSGMFSPLTSHSFIRVVIQSSSSLSQISRIQHSLFEYVDQVCYSTLDVIISDPENHREVARKLRNLSPRKVCIIGAIDAIGSINSFARELMCSGCRYIPKCMLFVPIHAQDFLVQVEKVQIVMVADIVVLGPPFDGRYSPVACDEHQMPYFLIPVPDSEIYQIPDSVVVTSYSSDSSCDTDKLNFEDLLTSCRSGRIVTTALMERILLIMRTKKQRSLFSCIAIYKQYLGSGASCLLAKVSTLLQDAAEAKCYFLNRKVDHEYLDDITEEHIRHLWAAIMRIKSPWTVVFVDDCTPALAALINRTVPTTLTTHVTLVYTTVTRDRQNGRPREERDDVLTIDPYLCSYDFDRILPQLISVYPESRDALNELKTWLTLNPSDRENRHIYVMLLTAARGKYTSVHALVEDKYMKDETTASRHLTLLAILDLYGSGDYSMMSVKELPSAKNALFDSLVIVRDVAGEDRVSFRHPLLAEQYLKVNFPAESIAFSVASGWNFCRSVFSSSISPDQGKLYVKSLLAISETNAHCSRVTFYSDRSSCHEYQASCISIR